VEAARVRAHAARARAHAARAAAARSLANRARAAQNTEGRFESHIDQDQRLYRAAFHSIHYSHDP
jgi:hypothetical protein